MKVVFKKLTLQNFYSYGKEQIIDFTKYNDNIVLIDGIDKDSEGSKIGSGKSSIFAGITYALFGNTVNNIKVNEVVNYIKGKNCLVTLEFKIGNNEYRIERGRVPKILNIFKIENEDLINISKSDDADNDKDIEKLIGIDFDTFLQTVLFSVANHKQFLSLRPMEQKRLFENIFKFDEINNITADIKQNVKDFITKISEIELVNQEIEITNSQIENNVERLLEESSGFETDKQTKIKKLNKKIKFYSNIDIDSELEKYSFLDELQSLKQDILNELSELKSILKDKEYELNDNKTQVKRNTIKIDELTNNLEILLSGKCSTCLQPWVDDNNIKETEQEIKILKQDNIVYSDIIENLEKEILKIKKEQSEKRDIKADIMEGMDTIDCEIDRKEIDNIEIILTNLHNELESVKNQKNYLDGEIDNNKKMIRQIDYTPLNEMTNLCEISKLMIKFSEDPKMRGKFLRKFIKQMNEIFRNFKLMIPDYNIHIQFNSDFSVRLMKLGKEVSAGTLSNGEKRIGEIMIMLALIKIFKLKNNISFNIMFMDEVLDSAINGTLLEVVYGFIEQFSIDENIRIFLISHREEIKEKVKENIFVVKSRGITTIQSKDLYNV